MIHFTWLYTAVSWVLLRWHQLFTAIGLAPTSGLNWALSIIFLVVTARLLLFRLFVKQVHYQRHMQEIQPQLQAIRERYKNDKAEQQRQMMKLQQEQGFNPLAGCLPIFLQFPIFIALFHTLKHLANSVTACDAHQFSSSKLDLYSFTPTETCNAAQAKLFNAPLAGAIRDGSDAITKLGGHWGSTLAVTIVLIVVSAAATFGTQRFAMARATTTPTGTAASVQKLMQVGIPLSVVFSGVFFPLGTVLYWFSSNSWTMFQQIYINKFHPHTPPQKPETGALGKQLAPKVGQKPIRDGGRQQPNRTVNLGKSDAGASTGSTAQPGPTTDGGAAAPGPRKPPPGQRPNRPSGRPPAKRPSQTKKRR